MMTKVTEWPKVTENDDGIRPAGLPDECFYCHSKVGEPHNDDCVCISALYRCRVYDARTKQRIGTYDCFKPRHWSAYDLEFHLNDSSWCSDNALDDIKWSVQPTGDLKTVIEGWTKADTEDTEFVGPCSCSLLSFEFEDILDDGPFIEVRETKEASDVNG